MVGEWPTWIPSQTHPWWAINGLPLAHHLALVGWWVTLIRSPNLLVWATSEGLLPAGGTFIAILASKSHWLQPVLILPVHGGPTLISVGGSTK
jgi:hypothetical protein